MLLEIEDAFLFSNMHFLEETKLSWSILLLSLTVSSPFPSFPFSPQLYSSPLFPIVFQVLMTFQCARE